MKLSIGILMYFQSYKYFFSIYIQIESYEKIFLFYYLNIKSMFVKDRKL